MIEDASLPLPAPSAPPEALDGPSDLLAVASPATARPFLLASGSIRAVGSETTGVDEIRAEEGGEGPPGRSPAAGSGPLLLARPRLRPGPLPDGDASPAPDPAANVIASPRSIRRETVGAGGSVVETVLLPERLPGAILEWRVRSAGRSGTRRTDAPPELRLSFEVPRPAAFRGDREHLVLRSPHDGLVRLLRVVPAPSSWRVEEVAEREDPVAEEEGAADPVAREGPEMVGEALVRVVVTLPGVTLPSTGTADRISGTGPRSVGGRREAASPVPGEVRITLLAVLADDVNAAAALLGRSGRVRVHQRRADEALRDARTGLLALRTGVGEMDDGLEWAKARATSLGGSTSGASIAGALEVLALASIGARPRAAERLHAFRGPGGTVTPEGWLAHAGYASWSGRPHPAIRDPDRLRAAARSLRTVEAGGRLRRAALRAVADLLDAVGRRDDAAEVRGGIGRAVRLPTVGSGGRKPADPSVASGDGSPGRALDPLATVALGSAGLLGPGGRASPSARALRAWSLYVDDAPDDAYPLLRSHLADAARGSPAGWIEHPLPFFLTPLLLLHGLLGARPDAPVGRLRLAPSLPPSWTAMELRGIRLGDAILDVGYTRDGAPPTFVLRPTGGAVPATVVFEPRTPERIARVLVDGDPAEVDTHPAGRRTAVRLQLPIDRERRVTLVGIDD